MRLPYIIVEPASPGVPRLGVLQHCTAAAVCASVMGHRPRRSGAALPEFRLPHRAAQGRNFSATHSELLHEWYPSRNLEPSTAFSIALIVRFTSHVADVFHRRFAKEFGDGLHEAISGFFNANKDYAAEAKRRAERNAAIKAERNAAIKDGEWGCLGLHI